ncbi:transposase [Caballeronia sp. Lep1P3]|uniref:transposase n=1 Tax=Caballeronia sp. Lep1P3 TaxID=2878150 RepID=UPI00351CDB6F
MTQTGPDTALLAVTLVGRDGKRRYDSQSKLRLIEACLQPGVSVAGLALKAGVNANLLRRWIKLHEQRRRAAGAPDIVPRRQTSCRL